MSFVARTAQVIVATRGYIRRKARICRQNRESPQAKRHILNKKVSEQDTGEKEPLIAGFGTQTKG